MGSLFGTVKKLKISLSISLVSLKCKFNNRKKTFKDYYLQGKHINCGAFASVKYCMHIESGQERAVKKIPKKNLTKKELNNVKTEINILENISHPNIIKFYDSFDDKKYICIVLELCEPQTLTEKLFFAPQQRLNEEMSAQIVLVLGKTLNYLHKQYIVHRDIKPDNVLFTNDGILKLTDFGLSYYSKNDDDANMKTFCGTPFYVAPEIIKKLPYDNKCDVWSLGVLLYQILSGLRPFEEKSILLTYKAIIECKVNFMHTRWLDRSFESQHLIKKMLQSDPSVRYTISQILQHPWIVEHMPKN